MGLKHLPWLGGFLLLLTGCAIASATESLSFSSSETTFLSQTVAQSTPSADTTSSSAHLLLGNPSDAKADVASPENYLMIKPEYALSYSRSKGIPNWVSWQLSQAWQGDAPRQNNFRSDTTLPTGWYRVTTTNYTYSGFDRGHMTASEDRTAIIEVNSATFLMTNILPQSPDNNRGPWAVLEEYCRTLVKQGNDLYIIAGGSGIGGTGENGTMSTLASGRITVPANTWKVVVVLPAGGGIGGINNNTRVIAVNMPNSQGIRTTDWRSFRTSVDQIEATTGYNFLSNVSEALQETLESKVDTQ